MSKVIINDAGGLRESVVQALAATDFSIYKIEEMTGISKSHVSDIKNRKRPGSLETIMRLATFFEIKFRFDSLP